MVNCILSITSIEETLIFTTLGARGETGPKNTSEGNRNEGYNVSAPGGRGDGSFVALLNNTPLIMAGGGGGAGSASGQFEDGDPGQATENGSRCGGTGGSGGQVCDADTGNIDHGLMAGEVQD